MIENKTSDRKIVIYWLFLKSLLNHKRNVFIAGKLIGGIPIWRLVIHDWMKFMPQEFPHYAYRFHASDKIVNDELMQAFADYSVLEAAPYGTTIRERFALAWLHHKNLAPHHYEYWRGHSIPQIYVREMVADWMGASKSYTGSWDMTEWLDSNLTGIEEHLTEVTKTYLRTVLIEVDKLNLS